MKKPNEDIQAKEKNLIDTEKNLLVQSNKLKFYQTKNLKQKLTNQIFEMTLENLTKVI